MAAKRARSPRAPGLSPVMRGAAQVAVRLARVDDQPADGEVNRAPGPAPHTCSRRRRELGTLAALASSISVPRRAPPEAWPTKGRTNLHEKTICAGCRTVPSLVSRPFRHSRLHVSRGLYMGIGASNGPPISPTANSWPRRKDIISAGIDGCRTAPRTLAHSLTQHSTFHSRFVHVPWRM